MSLVLTPDSHPATGAFEVTPNVVGSARSASALLAPFLITVTGLPSIAFAFHNNAGAAVKPTAYRVVVA